MLLMWGIYSTRSVFDHRAVVVGQTRDELLAGLAGVKVGRPEAGVNCGVGKPAGQDGFVFAGRIRSGWAWVASFMPPHLIFAEVPRCCRTSWTGTCGICCATDLGQLHLLNHHRIRPAGAVCGVEVAL